MNVKWIAGEFSTGFALGVVPALAVGFMPGLIFVLLLGTESLVFMLLFGLALGIPLGVLNVVVAILGDSHTPREAISAATLLNTDRTVTLVRMTTIGITGGLAFGLVFGFGDRLTFGVKIGIAVGCLFALLRLLLSAWGNWLLFVRLWLPLTGRLPWRPKRFLEDAHERGVLRQAGAVYQFRHAQLRDHLTNRYRNQPRPTPPPDAAEREGLNPAPEPR